MLTRSDIINIKEILDSSKWESFEKVANDLKEKWSTTNLKGANEFETIWNVAYKEGVIAGLTGFIEHLVKEAYD